MSNYNPPDINNIEITINEKTEPIDSNNIIIVFSNKPDTTFTEYDEFTSNNFISIDFKDGKIHAATEKGFYIIEPGSNTILDYYTYYHIGKSGDKLKNKNIVDTDV